MDGLHTHLAYWDGMEEAVLSTKMATVLGCTDERNVHIQAYSRPWLPRVPLAARDMKIYITQLPVIFSSIIPENKRVQGLKFCLRLKDYGYKYRILLEYI